MDTIEKRLDAEINNSPKIIAVDFDGTCVTHEYPNVGKDIGAEHTLKALVDKGHKLILLTMRGDKENGNKDLQDAINWFIDKGIELWGINENPEQHKWTSSPKVYAHIFIDDAALGVPLMQKDNERPYVNWRIVHSRLENLGYL